MGQQPICLDAEIRSKPKYEDKKKWLGVEVDIVECNECKKAPNVVAIDAEYFSYLGRVVNEGKFSRVQIYCENLCTYNIYTPLEGPTLNNVLAFWNSHGCWRERHKTKVKLDTDLDAVDSDYAQHTKDCLTRKLQKHVEILEESIERDS